MKSDPAIYPLFNIYPAPLSAESSSSETKDASTRLSASYPAIEICKWLNVVRFPLQSHSRLLDPTVYPYLTIYPAVSNTLATNATHEHSTSVVPVHSSLSSGYPDFNICTPISYPICGQRTNSLIDAPVGYPWSVYQIYPQVEASSVASASLPSIEIRLQAAYPTFEICESF